MAKLFQIDIASLCAMYNLSRFVETGTGHGESLLFACRFPFVSLWSCEIERVLANFALERVCHDERVSLFIGSSAQMLGMLSFLPMDEPILFWLDAHFPGADYGLRGYGDIEESVRLPLREELTLIRAHRRCNADVILIDDARIWLDGDFDDAIMLPKARIACPSERGIGFIEELFAATHHIEIIPIEQGQIWLTPKSGVRLVV